MGSYRYNRRGQLTGYTKTDKDIRREGGPIIGLIVVICIIAGGVGKYLHTSKTESEAPNTQAQTTYSLPNCTDQNLLGTVQSIISTNEKVAETYIQVSDEQETAFNPDPQTRTCTAQIIVPGGQMNIKYVISWQNASAGKWYVQVYSE